MRVAFAALVACALFSCQDPQVKKKLRDEACTRNLDCAFGLECVDSAGLAAAAAAADGGSAGGARTCQFKSFGDCEGDGKLPGPDGEPQCLNTYKCRAGHCTVQCAGHSDCKADEVCKVGICQKGSTVHSNCYDNRDCPYPETCYYGQCVSNAPIARCGTDLDCQGASSHCINGICQ